MKTFAYFASGIEKMDFSNFDYDRIILVDYYFKTGEYDIKVESNKNCYKNVL